MEGVGGFLGRVETGGEKRCWGDKSSGYETLCNVPQGPMMVLVHKEKRTGGTSCPQLQAQLRARAARWQTSPGETAGPWLWPQARSGYASVCPVGAGLSYLPCVPLCPTPPRKHPSCYTYLQPSLMCRTLRSLIKHSRTNFLGRFLPWRGRTKMEVTGRISVPAVTAVLLRKLVPPLPRQGVPRSPTACCHAVPTARQLRDTRI